MNEALEQVAYADRIVLNKTDLVSWRGNVGGKGSGGGAARGEGGPSLSGAAGWHADALQTHEEASQARAPLHLQVSPEDIERVTERLKGINGMATILKATRAQVPTDYVLGVGGFDLERIDADVRQGAAVRCVSV